MLLTNTNKFHLPHNAVRVDEFYHMLNSIDISEEYYIYEDIRILFLKTQIKDDKFKVFHSKIHENLINHKNKGIQQLYQECIINPSNDNLTKLLDCQYTDKKTFKQIFNETVRDYTEFFAFLGLLPTYYKFKVGGEKKHYVTQLLKDFISGDVSLEEILLNFKYRNSSKNYKSMTMYQLELRPFVVALNALEEYFNMGFKRVNSRILAAIIIYSQDEKIDWFLQNFDDPEKHINEYQHLFDKDFNKIRDELGRANLFLKPYLEEMGYVDYKGLYFVKGTKSFDEIHYPEKVVFCNSVINNVIDLTPVVGKILYKLYNYSKKEKVKIHKKELFDENMSDSDVEFLLEELIKLKCIESVNNEQLVLSNFTKQIAINPYSDFFDIDDANYVRNIKDIVLSDEQFKLEIRDDRIDNILNGLKPIALGSDGEKYEEELYKVLKENFEVFNVKWFGSNAVGKRLSDMLIQVKIFDGYKYKDIGIIIECKAGKSVRSFDERKEIDDVLNTLRTEKLSLDGVWYWVVNGDALPTVDVHGGYRGNYLSKSFMEKLHDIHFSVSEYMRVPTIVTAFSFDAISNYLRYLYPLVEKMKYNDIDSINIMDIPHFWVWSKKFMNMQYVMVHKELRLIE